MALNFPSNPSENDVYQFGLLTYIFKNGKWVSQSRGASQLPWYSNMEQARAFWKRLAAEAGFNLVDGSFEEGANISGWPDVVWCQTDGKYYQWHLDEAKTVAPGTDPAADTLWVPRTDETLRKELADDSGAAGVSMKRSLQQAIKMSIFDKLNTPVVDVREYGAVPDYILTDGTVNPTPTNNVEAINSAYIDAVDRGYALLLEGNFYCDGNIVLSHRPASANVFDSGGTQRKTIYANCVLWFGNVGTEVQPYANSAVYVGDRSSVGVYPVDIIGMMDIRYIGSQTSDLYGFHVEHSAYGNANVVCSGFRGAGAYIDGTIYYTIDSKNRPFYDNGLDILIESSQGSGGGLRFTSNLLEVRNAKLASKRKIKIQPGSDVIEPVYQSVGSSIVFSRVLMEGDSGPISGVAIDIDRVWETATVVNNGCVTFDCCWAEGFLKTNAFAAIRDSVVEFRNMFWGHGTDPGVPFIVVKDDKSRIKFNGGGAYFADAGPGTGCVVARGDSATDTYRSNVQAERFVPIGGGGIAYPMHDGAQLGRVISYDASSNTSVAVTKFQSGYPAGNSSDYMQSASIDMYALCNAWFGTKWREVDVALAGTDGSSYSCATVRVTKYATGAIVQIVKDATSKLSNPNGAILAWSGDIDGSWFRPTVTMTASMSVNEYGVSY